MKTTLSYYTGLIYKEFYRYAVETLERETGLSYGAVPFIIYTGKFPGCTQAELTRALKMDWGHSQRMTERLSEGGFIRKEKDGKYHSLTLTEEGKRAYGVCHSVFSSFDEERLSVLTDDERKTLFHLLAKLTAKED